MFLHLFPKLIISMEGKRFDFADINANTEGVLNTLKKKIQECIEGLKHCWSRYVWSEGDYFKGDLL